MRAEPMALALVALIALDGGCTKKESSPPTPDAGVSLATVDAAVPPPVPLAPKEDPPSNEAPPSSPAAGPPPAGIPKYHINFTDDVVLEGTFNPPSEDKNEGDNACEALHIMSPIRVVNEKGIDADPHPQPGGTTRVCLWNWNEPKRWSGANMLQRNSRVKVKGHVSSPLRSHHPRAILFMDLTVLSASPPAVEAPPSKWAEGESFVIVRKVDVATRTLSLDLAFLYFGDEAKRIAKTKGKTLPEGRNWFVLNDSNQLRTIVMPAQTWPLALGEKEGSGWSSVKLEDLAKDAADHETADPNAISAAARPPPYYVRVKTNALSAAGAGGHAFRRVNLE